MGFLQLSNGDLFEKTHDELDFEFLGNIRGKEWRIQTNIYGNGSTATGREERYELWFDPTKDFHRYSILWTESRILSAPFLLSPTSSKHRTIKIEPFFRIFFSRFFVDGIPIREIINNEAMEKNFPAKPMSLYATIWDGSSWATSGGRYKVDYRRAPYIAEFADLAVSGRAVDPIDHSPAYGSDIWRHRQITPAERRTMVALRRKHMTYSYCYDKERYPKPPEECVVDEKEKKGIAGRRRPIRRRRRSDAAL